MHLSKITLTEQGEYGAECFAKQRNESDRMDYERRLAETNRVARDEHRKAERLAETEHNDKQREAHDAHTGDEPFAFVLYTPGDPFTPDETPFEPRSTEELVGVALSELLDSCAQRVHRDEVEAYTRSVMSLPHADRCAAIDAFPESQD